jgi:hypothetical protein
MKPQIPFGIISIEHSFPANTNYYKQSFKLTVEYEPKFTAAYFWAQQFWFYGGDGGYYGLQSDGDINGTRQKIAIFSIWKSVAAIKSSYPGSSAESFGHEGSGYSCKIPFPWEEGSSYKLEISSKPSDNIKDNISWEASILNITSNQTILIGCIAVPTDWGKLQPKSNFFVEYFRDVPSCFDTPFEKSIYGNLVMTEEREIEPINSSYKTYGQCAEIGTISKNEYNDFVIESGCK